MFNPTGIRNEPDCRAMLEALTLVFGDYYDSESVEHLCVLFAVVFELHLRATRHPPVRKMAYEPQSSNGHGAQYLPERGVGPHVVAHDRALIHVVEKVWCERGACA